MTYLNLIYTYFRLGVMNEVQYRTNFWVEMLNLALGLLSALGGLAVVYGQTDTLGGWGPAELLALVGVFFLMRGLIYTVVQPKHGVISGRCTRGHAGLCAGQARGRTDASEHTQRAHLAATRLCGWYRYRDLRDRLVWNRDELSPRASLLRDAGLRVHHCL